MRSASGDGAARELAASDERDGRDVRRTGEILVVEDDPEVRELLELVLKDEGHHVVRRPTASPRWNWWRAARSGPTSSWRTSICRTAWTGSSRGEAARQTPSGDPGHHPDRRHLDRHAARYRAQNCVQLNKPVKLTELTQAHPIAASRQAPRTLPSPDAAPAARRRRSSSSSMTTAMSARRCASCSRTMARRSRIMRPARLSRSLSSRPRSLPADRCLSARNERARIAAAAQAGGPRTARDHDHRQ